MGPQELRQVWRPDLLLALDDQLDVRRQLGARLEPGAQRSKVQHQSRLVVDHPASIQTTIRAVCGLEGRRLPKLLAPRGLNVVVRVDQHGRRSGSVVHAFSDDVGMSPTLGHDLHLRKPCVPQQLGHRVGRARHLRRLEARRGHTRNASKLAQLRERSSEALL